MTSTPLLAVRAADVMPAVYLRHGAPPLADDETWKRELAGWSAALPIPRAILVVSAHWEAAPLTIGATTTVPLAYDFWGFPERYYQVTYDAPGAPDLADAVRRLVATLGLGTHEAHIAAWTTVPMSLSSRCTRRPTSPRCRSRCRRSTRNDCSTSADGSHRCGPRAC